MLELFPHYLRRDEQLGWWWEVTMTEQHELEWHCLHLLTPASALYRETLAKLSYSDRHAPASSSKRRRVSPA